MFTKDYYQIVVKKVFSLTRWFLFAQNLGVNEINFHIIFKSGVPKGIIILGILI